MHKILQNWFHIKLTLKRRNFDLQSQASSYFEKFRYKKCARILHRMHENEVIVIFSNFYLIFFPTFR